MMNTLLKCSLYWYDVITRFKLKLAMWSDLYRMPFIYADTFVKYDIHLYKCKIITSGNCKTDLFYNKRCTLIVTRLEQSLSY